MNETNINNCLSCGVEIPRDHRFCLNCFENNNSNDVTTNSGIENIMVLTRNNKKIITILLLIFLTVGIFFVAYQQMQKVNLKKNLQDVTWYSTSDNDNLLILEFGNSKVSYSGYFGILGKRDIANLRYEVVSGNKLKIRDKEISVELDKTDGTVIFRPSFINTDSISIWVEE